MLETEKGMPKGMPAEQVNSVKLCPSSAEASTHSRNEQKNQVTRHSGKYCKKNSKDRASMCPFACLSSLRS